MYQTNKMFNKAFLLLTCAIAADSLCDKYTTALLVDNTFENQQTLLTLLVNTVVIGNYTLPNTGVLVPGILSSEGGLLKYFTGDLNTTNVGGRPGQVNFLDGGGAAPLLLNEPANDTMSKQYFLMKHLYEIFGTLLGCSLFGKGYDGAISMYETHKFMKLSKDEVDYFIDQVGLAAKSFGVSDEDTNTVAIGLNSIFNQRCNAPFVITNDSAGLQSICNGNDCPLSTTNSCSLYDSIEMSSGVSIKISIVSLVFVLLC